MVNLEKNIKKSFGYVKNDIIQLQNKVIELNEVQKKILENLEELSNKKTKSKSKTFVASKTGKKFHVKDCPFAKNIKPKSRVTFKSKNTALNQGYKPCECVK